MMHHPKHVKFINGKTYDITSVQQIEVTFGEPELYYVLESHIDKDEIPERELTDMVASGWAKLIY